MGLPAHATDVAPEPRAPGRPDPRVAVVPAGGAPDDVGLPDDVGPGPLVVAADSGVHLARRLGLAPDVVVGDLDSVHAEQLAAVVAAGAVVEEHPADKDASDLELALDAAIARGATRVVVLGLHGGRLDHHLAGLLLLASPRWRDVRIEGHGDAGRVVVVHDRADLTGRVGDLCTLLPVGGTAVGVTTDGLRWPLRDDDLAPGTTRGLSNVFAAGRATVSLTAGTLLAILPPAGAGAEDAR
jgi:thiamine pyrophosphokinase